MEMQWNRSNCPYLRRSLWETMNVEQTQEVRITDGMPDIGRVICTWGQPVLRSKEWRGESAAVTGGVTVWTLYAPEDGSEGQCVETWIPFQAKWNLPESQREGTLRINCCLRQAETRVLSSRKMMLRVSLGILAEGLEPAEAEIYQPADLPERTQILEKSYPAVLPVEAGEKQIMVEEDISWSGEMPAKILCCRVYPEVTEQNVIGGRGVFRGNCRVRLLCLTENGKILPQTHQFTFAQYGDLQREYDKDAGISVVLVPSAVETEISENGIHLRCGLVGQYVVFDRQMLRLAEDAYGLSQQVVPQLEQLQLPMVLDSGEHRVDASARLSVEAAQVVDMTFLPDQPCQFREGDEVLVHSGGVFQVLYYDLEGNLQSALENWSGEWSIPMEESCGAFVHLLASGEQEQMVSGEEILCNAEMKLEVLAVSRQPMEMITGLQMGEKMEPDPNRPSVILRRAGERSLWELAKMCGSTVDSICKANQLSGEPDGERMLLIPVL